MKPVITKGSGLGTNVIQNIYVIVAFITERYGNTGCGVFKRKLEIFLAKSQLQSNEITKFGEN